MAKSVRVRDNVGYEKVVREAKQLDTSTRNLVIRAVQDAASQYGEDEELYVRAKIESKLSDVEQSTSSWIRQLARGFRNLANWHAFRFAELMPPFEYVYTLSGATLFYFINPFDVIPDHTHGTGYIDDAFAFYYCVRQLPEDWDR